jgi:hypothetical protein
MANKERKHRASRPESSDKLPPHSHESEQGILGCILLSPRESFRFLTEKLHGFHVPLFYDLRNGDIFDALNEMARKPGLEIDTVSLRQWLKDRKLLEQIGGDSYLMTLPDFAPSAANIGYHWNVVREKALLRYAIQTCAGLAESAHNYNGHVEDLLDCVERDLKKLSESRAAQNEICDSANWNDLLEFDTSNDVNAVIGMRNGKTTRWACKGHGGWLIGPSGVGKSSLMLQLGVSFACGKSSWGVTPVRPLRVLIIQAENDKGDLAEMARGIESGLKVGEFTDEIAHGLISKNVRVRSVTGKIGQDFCGWLKRQIVDFRADLVLVDPLLSFAGIDVSRQDQTTQFCRVWLDPVLRETGAVLLSVHHTGKPRKESKGGSVPSIYDLMYEGIGSSELVNWARFVMLLQPCGDGNFRLVFAKRGNRAWAQHPPKEGEVEGEKTTTIWIRHAANGDLFWEQIDPPEEPEPSNKKDGRPSKVETICSMNLYSFISKLPAEGLGKNETSKRLESWLATQHFDANLSTCKRSVEELVKRKKLKKTEAGLYLKGDEA